MTVKELIAVLDRFPPELEVVMEGADTPRRAIAIRSAALDLVERRTRHLCTGTTANASDYDDAVGLYWSWHPDDE